MSIENITAITTEQVESIDYIFPAEIEPVAELVAISPERLAQLERAEKMVVALSKLADLQAGDVNYEIKGIAGKQLTRNVFVTLWQVVEGKDDEFPNLQAVYGEPQAYLPDAIEDALKQWRANYGN